MAWTCSLLFLLMLALSRGVFALGGYRLQSLVETSKGDLVANLKLINQTETYGPDIDQLQLTVSFESQERVRVHITDASSTRWEVPQSLVPRLNVATSKLFKDSHHLQFSCTADPFTFSILRKSTGERLFSSSPGLTFKDQYLEVSTYLPTNASLFGLGESTRPSGFRLRPNSTYSLWATDTPSQEINKNLYASWPFYLDVRRDGLSHGVLLLNSNGMDVEYLGNQLTFKVVGGVLDFTFFAGPSPLSVVQQLTELVGKPAPMPYWSLGFHHCRYGFRNVEELQSVVESYRLAGIPLEVLWTDIDYMDAFKDFTLDPVNFPREKMVKFVNRLHADELKFVIILDPGIKVEKNYSTYERGTALDIFIKDVRGQPYLGQVWPGPVHFLDFLHPQTVTYWTREIAEFHTVLSFDGLWIDMNEVSNFCTGVTCSLSNKTDCFTSCCLICSENSDSPTKWDNPPFSINNNAVRNRIGSKTMAASATHYGGVLEYDAHNLYGLSEAIATNEALKSVTRKRPFMLSRSTFIGSGRVTAHWSGDNGATWEDLRYSIVSVLNSGLVGIPMVGADICGFLGNTTEELCNRWIQAGAFYPFSRNHNDMLALPQELYRWKSVTESSRTVLSLRYRMLPYLYTLFYHAHVDGSPVAWPLFFAFPRDQRALGVDSQFMLGSSILVSPVLHQGATSVEAYFPEGTWYNMFDYSKVVRSSGSFHVLPTPYNSTNVHVRGGSIVPMQGEAMTTAAARRTLFTLLVAFSSGTNTASGSLFLDNGEDVEMELKPESANLIQFSAEKLGGSKVLLKSQVSCGEFALKQNWLLGKVIVLGMMKEQEELVVLGMTEEQEVMEEQEELADGRNLLPVSSHEQVQKFTELNLPIGRSFHVTLKAKDTSLGDRST